MKWAVLGVSAGFVALLIYLISKTTKQKVEINNLKETIKKQQRIVKAYADTSKQMSRLVEEQKRKGEETMARVEEAKNSEEPVKESINVGNSIVNNFNSSV